MYLLNGVINNLMKKHFIIITYDKNIFLTNDG